MVILSLGKAYSWQFRPLGSQRGINRTKHIGQNWLHCWTDLHCVNMLEFICSFVLHHIQCTQISLRVSRYNGVSTVVVHLASAKCIEFFKKDDHRRNTKLWHRIYLSSHRFKGKVTFLIRLLCCRLSFLTQTVEKRI